LNKEIEIRQVKSQIGSKPKARATLRALGLGKIGKTRTFEDTPSVRGMIKKVSHLIQVKILEK
jgi:large subunit ribosomal protein L30